MRDRLGRLFAHDRHRFDQYGHQLAWCRNWATTLSAAALDREIQPVRVRNFIREFDLEPTPACGDTWPWPVRITTLGRFEIEVDGQAVTFSGKASRRVLALLKAIVAFGGREVKDYLLIDALWADQEGDVARDAFRVALHRLRKLLGRADAIEIDDGRVSLNQRLCRVDSLALEADLRRGEMPGAVLARYRGSFLPDDISEPWSSLTRERLRARFLREAEQLGAQLERDGKFESARDLYLRGLDLEATAETLHQGLMRCHAALDATAEAIGVYQRMRKTLATTLGIQPGPSSEALYRRLVEGTGRPVTGR